MKQSVHNGTDLKCHFSPAFSGEIAFLPQFLHILFVGLLVSGREDFFIILGTLGCPILILLDNLRFVNSIQVKYGTIKLLELTKKWLKTKYL